MSTRGSHLLRAAGAAAASPPPLVVDIKRHSLEDGPGIRSVVFFKGCPLRCSFCQNPETQHAGVEIAFSSQRCIGAGSCSAACEVGAIDLTLAGRIRRDACTRCGACTDACPTGALRRIGVAYEPDALAEILLRDRRYYETSRGGVTLSGGEPTLFPIYLEQLLRRLKAEGIHVILETGGYFHPYETFRDKVLPYLDAIYFSLKIADPELHRQHTGKPNALILDNLRRLAGEPGIQLEARIPLVPGLTDTRANLTALVAMLREARVPAVQLLPYNPLGAHMAKTLGRAPSTAPRSFMSPQELERIGRMFEDIVRASAA